MTSEILMLEDGCTLLRLLMADEHYKDGSVTDNGISLQDLQDRGYSLDIKSMAVQAVIEERAQTQSLKRPVERHTAFISEFTKNKKEKLLDHLTDFYMNKILPVLGGLISKNKEAYTYLPNSIDEFLTTENLCKELKNAGLEPIHVKAFSMNISTLIIARKI